MMIVFIRAVCMVILMKMLIECFMALSAYALLCTQAFKKHNAPLTLRSMVFLESMRSEQSILCMGHKTSTTHFYQYHHTYINFENNNQLQLLRFNRVTKQSLFLRWYLLEIESKSPKNILTQTNNFHHHWR